MAGRNEKVKIVSKEIYDHLILPQQSKCFLKSMEDVLEMNLYLAQNRFYFEKTDVKDRNKGDGKDGGKMYGPLLAERVRGWKEDPKGVRYQGVREKECYGGKLESILKCLNERNAKIAHSFIQSDSYILKPYDKMILGEGSGAYFNVQPLRLHHLYGVPYIPASVLKGTLRNVWIMEKYEGKEEKALADDEFILLFGGERKDSVRIEGALVFLDTYPDQFTLGLDVQTNHFRDYYNNPRVQPTDDQDTRSISFMCLRDAIFRIWIACGDEKVWISGKEEIDTMMHCMFTQYGVGAKTALGYGIGI